MSINQDYWNKRRVLITGHEGFLGAWLTKVLVGCGSEVVGLDKVIDRENTVLHEVSGKFEGIEGNIADFNLVKKIMDDFKPQTILHIAAEAIVGVANKNPIATFESNIQGTWNILEAARDNKELEGIVAASSDKAYGSHENLPYTEDIALHGDHPYDVSKSCSDLLCRSYFLTFKVPVCVTRCGNIYGPGDHNFSRLIPDAVCCALKEEQFIIRSDGEFTRDYIYVEDVVNAYLTLAEKMKVLKLEGEAFNFSNDRPLSVLDVFKRISSNVNKKNVEPRILNEAQFEIKHQYLSSQKAKDILSWESQFSIDEGLKDTISWYATNVLDVKEASSNR